jgi:hypothetical protein
MPAKEDNPWLRGFHSLCPADRYPVIELFDAACLLIRDTGTGVEWGRPLLFIAGKVKKRLADQQNFERLRVIYP